MRVGAVQLNSTANLDRNLSSADRLVREAAGRGAELVVLPEKWSVLGTGEQMAAGAEPLDGPAITWARNVARELGIELLAGSIVERVPARAKTSNTSVHVAADGELRAVYRKIHMFDVEVDGVLYAESEHEEPGEELVVSELANGARLGMSICYVIAANQIGAHPPGHRSGGRSLIVDPWGLVLAGAPDTEAAIVADLDFEVLRDVRRRLPSLGHRRPEAYVLARRTPA